MNIKKLDPKIPDIDSDWEGNNAAFRCPICKQVFIVSEMIHNGYRQCKCEKSIARVKGGKKSGGEASIEWSD
jgi:hypothetical protein